VCNGTMEHPLPTPPELELPHDTAIQIDTPASENNGSEVEIPPRDNIPRFENWKRAMRCEVLWLALVNLTLISALIWDSDADCPSYRLKIWVYVLVPLQFIMMIPNALLQVHMPSLRDQLQQRRYHMGLPYLLSRFLNVVWAIWAIVGIIWTFQAKSCAASIPVLYFTCYVLAVMNCVLLGFPLLICCCSLPATCLMYLCCPQIFGVKKIPKASPRLIKKVTTLKKFQQGLVNKEDANCAICLCEYEEGEDIRFLQCEHHFHSDCIMEWLVKNKTCPFCKQEIDKKPQKKKEQHLSFEDDDDEEVPLQSRAEDV